MGGEEFLGIGGEAGSDRGVIHKGFHLRGDFTGLGSVGEKAGVVVVDKFTEFRSGGGDNGDAGGHGVQGCRWRGGRRA